MQSGLGLLMGKFPQVLTELSVFHSDGQVLSFHIIILFIFSEKNKWVFNVNCLPVGQVP